MFLICRNPDATTPFVHRVMDAICFYCAAFPPQANALQNSTEFTKSSIPRPHAKKQQPISRPGKHGTTPRDQWSTTRQVTFSTAVHSALSSSLSQLIYVANESAACSCCGQSPGLAQVIGFADLEQWDFRSSVPFWGSVARFHLQILHHQRFVAIIGSFPSSLTSPRARHFP